MIRGFSIFSVCLVALVGLALAAKHPMDAIDSYQLASGQPVTLGAVMTSVIVFYFIFIGASLSNRPIIRRISASGQLVGIPLFIVLLYRGVEVGDVALGLVATIGFGLSVWSIWLTLRST